MIPAIEEILKYSFFNPIDIYRAEFFYRRYSVENPLFYLVVMVLSNHVQNGNSCVSLRNLACSSLRDAVMSDMRLPDHEIPDVCFPEYDELAGIMSECSGGDDSLSENPLVISGENLYFSRQRFYELDVIGSIRKRCCQFYEISPETSAYFHELFPDSYMEADYQAIAAFIALKSSFSVISGGPGTGKTSTVIRIISILINDYILKGMIPEIALAAPTGKAAARLKESIDAAIDTLNISDNIRSCIPREAYTIHRLLGRRGGSSEFIHGQENRLNRDIIVVDESSMIDLALMSKFFSAVKDDARIILLGDRDQLASVEGGAVFGDICDRGSEHGFSVDMSLHLKEFFKIKDKSGIPMEQKKTLMSDRLVVLNRSYRFSAGSLIGTVSQKIRAGDANSVLNCIKSGDPEIGYISHGEVEKFLKKRISDYIASCPDSVDPDDITGGFLSRFMIITALRNGQWGVEGMNLLSERIFSALGIIRIDSPFYSGRPVMITGNNYSLSLFNGDRGIVGDGSGEKTVMFSDEKVIAVSRIPEHITSFAMTIHKSQGSEFDEVMIVLPENYNPVLSRELLYTAVTRARKKVIIAGTDEIIKKMVESPTFRQTGLRDGLWNDQ